VNTAAKVVWSVVYGVSRLRCKIPSRSWPGVIMKRSDKKQREAGRKGVAAE